MNSKSISIATSEMNKILPKETDQVWISIPILKCYRECVYLKAESCSSETFSTKNGATPTVETCKTAVSVSVWTVNSSAMRPTSTTILWYTIITVLSRTSRAWALFFFWLPPNFIKEWIQHLVHMKGFIILEKKNKCNWITFLCLINYGNKIVDT